METKLKTLNEAKESLEKTKYEWEAAKAKVEKLKEAQVEIDSQLKLLAKEKEAIEKVAKDLAPIKEEAKKEAERNLTKEKDILARKEEALQKEREDLLKERELFRKEREGFYKSMEVANKKAQKEAQNRFFNKIDSIFEKNLLKNKIAYEKMIKPRFASVAMTSSLYHTQPRAGLKEAVDAFEAGCRDLHAQWKGAVMQE